MMYRVIGDRVDPEYSPIDRKLMEYSEKLNKAISFTMYECTLCGQRERGITNVLDGTFKCRQCILSEEAQRLNNDPDMIKQEKIWNMRMAIRRHKENEAQWTDQTR
jgi:hypothetical protein